ncbi:twin-arginine translocase TatA/TatE family subunit [Microcella sp.]|uniref:twin-arginine translocase TatA/TatE family subunit n=1 Tax=Microcella sp. TaxID=1913979 RepID=UPI003F6EA8AE
MGSNLTGWHGLILLLVVLLLFAAPKLPMLARSLGQSITIFRGEVKKPAGDEHATADNDAAKPSA